MPLTNDPDIDRMRRELRRLEAEITEVFDSTREDVLAMLDASEIALSGLIASGGWEAVVTAGATVFGQRIASTVAQGYSGVTRREVEVLEAKIRVITDFNIVNERAVQYLQTSRLNLIAEFTDQQRLATREVLVDGATRGVNPREQARAFRESIGLTGQQQRAVNNYRQLLFNVAAGDREALTRELRDGRFDGTIRGALRRKEPLRLSQIERMTDRYRQRTLKLRAETIARTEALRAIHAAQYEVFQQALENGVVRPQELEKEWVTSLDGRERASHAQANGQRVSQDRPFIVGGAELRYPGDPLAPGREVINCRCVAPIRVRR